MEVIYAHEHPATRPELSIFLAGPSPRGNQDYDWRPGALEHLSSVNFAGTAYVPLPRDGQYHSDYDHNAQVDWELQYLEDCDAIAFWVPRDVQKLPGFTTNVEFGLFARSGKAVLGYPPEAQKMKYLHRVAERFNVPIWPTLEQTLFSTMWLAGKRVHEFRN